MVLPVILYGSSLLREKAFDINAGIDFKTIAENMSQTLKKAGGIGLAGPQVNVLKRIFIIDTMPLQEDGIPPLEQVYLNPEILHFDSAENEYKEGCLSIPGINENVIRPEKITVRYRNEYFDVREEVLNGVIARIFQHEYDHLQGILFVDRINPLKRRMLRSKLHQIEKTSHR
ncbi:MAG: peptide deformylase [Bacteroidales bacterium]|nr:peptide deformylase [Bacteroidales bacterium]